MVSKMEARATTVSPQNPPAGWGRFPGDFLSSLLSFHRHPPILSGPVALLVLFWGVALACLHPQSGGAGLVPEVAQKRIRKAAEVSVEHRSKPPPNRC